MQAETRYAAVGDADVAYKVVGEGPADLLYCHGIGSHIEQLWELPALGEFMTGLSSFSPLLVFDRRGTGASDHLPTGSISTWEEWTDIGWSERVTSGTKATSPGAFQVLDRPNPVRHCL